MSLKRIASVLVILVLAFGCVATASENVFVTAPVGCVNFEEAEFRYDLNGYLAELGPDDVIQVEVEGCSVAEWSVGLKGRELTVLPKVPGEGTLSLIAFTETDEIPFTLQVHYLTMQEWALERLWKYPLILLGLLALFGGMLFCRRFRSSIVVHGKIGESSGTWNSSTKFGPVFLNSILKRESALNSTVAIRLGGMIYCKGKYRGICWVKGQPLVVLDSKDAEISSSKRMVTLKPGGWITVQGLAEDATLTVTYNNY